MGLNDLVADQEGVDGYEVMEQVTRWGLDDYLKDRTFENLIYK
jgi:hypothetical protein